MARVTVAIDLPPELEQWARERRLNLRAVLITALKSRQSKVKRENKGVKNEVKVIS